MAEAGAKLRAADVSFYADSMTLPNGQTVAVADELEPWGEPLVLPNPGVNVSVVALGNGSVVDDGTGQPSGMRLQISLDGGGTWTTGQGPRDQSGSGAATRRGGLSAIHLATGVPTGDIWVQALRESGGTTAQFWYGTVLALVLPAGERS